MHLSQLGGIYEKKLAEEFKDVVERLYQKLIGFFENGPSVCEILKTIGNERKSEIKIVPSGLAEIIIKGIKATDTNKEKIAYGMDTYKFILEMTKQKVYGEMICKFIKELTDAGFLVSESGSDLSYIMIVSFAEDFLTLSPSVE